jgi:hypothetical protein
MIYICVQYNVYIHVWLLKHVYRVIFIKQATVVLTIFIFKKK